ncbi:MAG: YecA family protein, partial [Janthinobacterium sp.]
MSSISTTTPLSDDEYAELDTLLAAPALAGRAMDVSMLEGFLTAVALSPKQITQEQWLPWVWDKAAGSAAPAQDRAASLAQRHHAYMVEWLAKDADSFEPIYVCGPEWSVPAWCAGFLLGTSLDKPQWAALAVSHPQYLAPFQYLATASELDDEAAETAMDGVIPAVIAINAAW